MVRRVGAHGVSEGNLHADAQPPIGHVPTSLHFPACPFNPLSSMFNAFSMRVPSISHTCSIHFPSIVNFDSIHPFSVLCPSMLPTYSPHILSIVHALFILVPLSCPSIFDFGQHPLHPLRHPQPCLPRTQMMMLGMVTTIGAQARASRRGHCDAWFEASKSLADLSAV